MFLDKLLNEWGRHVSQLTLTAGVLERLKELNKTIHASAEPLEDILIAINELGDKGLLKTLKPQSKPTAEEERDTAQTLEYLPRRV